MQANSEAPKQDHDDALLPLFVESLEPRGGMAWLVSGLCAFALALVVYFKLDPAVVRAGSQAGEQATASSERTKVLEAPAPAAERGEADLHAAADPSPPPVARESEAQPERSPEQSPANSAAAAPAGATAPSAGTQQPKLGRKLKRASAELQRVRHELTVAANLGQSAAPETTQSVDSSAPQTPGPAEAPSAVSSAAAAPAAAVKPEIPDNPF